MSRTVFCQFLQKEAPGLDFQFYPGDLGKKIFDNISKEAFSQWQSKQTMLINEKKLNMMNLEHRKLLEEQMQKFLFEGEGRIVKTASHSQTRSCSIKSN